MSYQVLYPDTKTDVKRLSSIDQFKDFLSVWKQGGWAPIVFDKLDGITCDTIMSHPVVISFGDDLGYVYPEGHCTYSSDRFIYFDKEGVEHTLLPECMGGTGEFYDYYVDESAFVNYDNDASVGVSNRTTLRTGLSYVKADETLPPVE